MSDLISRQDDFEEQLHNMFDHIWDCQIDHPIFDDTVGDLMRAVIQLYNDQEPSQVARDIATTVENEQDMRVMLSQPKITDCDYCHEDSDGYVTPLEKNCHAFVTYSPIDGWILSLKANGWHGEAQIKFCPMCGRRLTDG